MTKTEAKKLSKEFDAGTYVDVGPMASGGSWWAIMSSAGRTLSHGWAGKGDLDLAEAAGLAARDALVDEIVATLARPARA